MPESERFPSTCIGKGKGGKGKRGERGERGRERAEEGK